MRMLTVTWCPNIDVQRLDHRFSTSIIIQFGTNPPFFIAPSVKTMADAEVYLGVLWSESKYSDNSRNSIRKTRQADEFSQAVF